MDVAQLQRAALAPRRWTNIVQRNSVSSNDSELNSDSVQPVSSITTCLREYEDWGSRLVLVPGGRFLFSINSRGLYVDLWDLGPAGQSPWQKPVLVASVESLPPESSVTGYAVCDAGEGRLRIGLMLDVVLDRMMIKVYEVQVDDRPRPLAFDLLGSLEIQGKQLSGQPKIIGDRVILPFLNVLLVWNFGSRRYYAIRFEDAETKTNPSLFRLIGDVVLEFLPAKHICAWGLPDPPEDCGAWRSISAEVIAFEAISKAALDKPVSTVVPFGRSTGAIIPSKSFPILWDSCGNNSQFPQTPLVFQTIQMSPGGTVASIARFSIEVSGNWVKNDTEADIVGPNVTLKHLTTFTFGKITPSFGYRTYAYDDNHCVPTPIPSSYASFCGGTADDSSTKEFIYTVIPADGSRNEQASDDGSQLESLTLESPWEDKLPSSIRLTIIHKASFGYREVECLCPASGRAITRSSYGRYYSIIVDDFLC